MANVRTVAAAAAVSAATVSNTYNRPEKVSAAVRERVLAAAAAQGYSPDAAARSLRTGRAGTIGVLFTVGLSYAFSDPYYVELLAGLTEVAEGTRTAVTLIPVETTTAAADGDDHPVTVQAVERAVIDGAVADGIDDDHPALRALARRDIPVVNASDTGRGRRVSIDDRAAGRLVGTHLAALGHRRVTVVVSSRAAPPDRRAGVVEEASLYRYSRLRLDGIRDALGPEVTIDVVSGGRNDVASGQAAGGFTLDATDPPTAIAADSDVLALGVLEALRHRGVRAGADVAVTGFDDLPAAATAQLTTVRQPIRDKGRLLGRMLLDPHLTDDHVELPTELVVRSSTVPDRPSPPRGTGDPT